MKLVHGLKESRVSVYSELLFCVLEVQGLENIMSALVKWVILTLETFYLVLFIRNVYLNLVGLYLLFCLCCKI